MTPAKVSAWVLDPSIANSIYETRMGPSASDDAIYDLSGRKLCHAPKSGTYIKNGKKYAAH